MNLRPGRVALVALPPVTVLALDPAGWYPFGPAKWLAVAVLVPLATAHLITAGPLRLHRGATLAAAALVAWLALAAAVGEDPLYAWTGTPERHLGVATWFVCALALVAGQCVDWRSADGRALGAGMLAAGAGLAVVGTAEALGWEPALLDAGGRLTATFGSPAYLGAATTLLLPSCAGIAADRARPSAARWVGAVASAGLAVACVGSGARAAWFGLGVAAVACGWVHRRRLRSHPRLTTAVAVGTAVFAVVLVVASPVGDRLSGMFDAEAPGGRGRLDEWQVAAAVIADHPIAGTGPEGYRIAFGGAVDEQYERAHGRDPLPDRAHSAPLDVAATGGVVALAAWGTVMAFGLRAAGRVLRASPAVAGAGVALIAYAGNSLLLFPTVELEPLAWLLAGVVIAADRSMAPPAPGAPRLVPRAVPAALVLLALVGAVAGTTELIADRRAERATRALAAGRADAAVAAAESAVDLRPDVVRYHLLAARALVAGERGSDAALAEVAAALDVSPRDPIAQLEQLELLVGRAAATRRPDHVDAAVDAADALVARDPNRAAAWLQAGAAHRLAGDEDAAVAAWTRAERLAPASPAAAVNLARLHLEAGRIDEARAAAARAAAIDPDDERVRQVLALVEAAG